MGQSLHQVYGHIIFSTKDRHPYINSTIEPNLFEYIGGIVRNLEGSIIAINGMPDHLHLIVRASKKVSDTEFMRRLKGSSSKWMSEQGIKGFQWQGGYGWFSVSAKDLDAAVTYVENQKAHHKTESFQDEVRKFLKAYGVEFDEKYLWD
jgi:putative transposase